MNFLLLCGKKQRRDYESVFQKDEYSTLLGTETVLKNDIIKKITDGYNPHGVIIVNGVSNKSGIELVDIIALLKSKRPAMRIIYVCGEIDNTEWFMTNIYSRIIPLGVFDIVTNQKWEDIFSKISRTPFTREQLDESLKSDNQAKDTGGEHKEKADFQPLYDVDSKSTVKLDRESLSLNDFDMLNVAEIVESDIDKPDVKHIVIGLTELQHHIGCTHISFEIGAFLRQKRKNVCVIICDDKTYGSLCNFYDVPDSYVDEGFLIKGINVLPYSKLGEAKEKFNYIVCDFGFPRQEQAVEFAASPVKIMLCSAADWDISTTMNYINNAKFPYVRNINYCFYPISQARFINFNKQLIKAGCVAYRIKTSAGCFQPCEGNSQVYIDILRRFTDIVPVFKKKRRANTAK